ncbi:MAG: hypothetical protein ABIR18_07975 [Chitinophagaceae bacterium]
MKNWSVKVIAVMLFALPVLFSACIKDSCEKERTYTFYVPVYKTKAQVRENIKSNAPRTIEHPGKISIKGSTIFLNEIDRGIHIIDNSNPSSPKNIAFIDIPGNMDIAVKGNILYADFFRDLVAIDITNPTQVTPKKFVDDVFPYRSYGNGFVQVSNDQIITDWVKHDTTVVQSCERLRNIFDTRNGGAFFLASSSSAASSSSPTSASPIGVGGSMARFTIINNHLYTVSHSDLNVFDITTAADPIKGSKTNIGWNIETIYPFENKLFIGSQTGMFIYDVSNPTSPVAAGQFSHARSCDPVIADNDYAYVTLRSGTACQGFTNQLDIVKLNNPGTPVLKKSYPLTNPHGLSKDGNLLFICDGTAGLKIYEASDVLNLQLIKSFDMDAYDVIAYNKIALVVGKGGLFQYDYSNAADAKLLSKISVK